MARCRFLAAACAGTLFYVLVAIVCGRDGLWAHGQLLEQKRLLSAHTAGIEKTHEELALEKVALQNDADVIAAYARKLGYVGQGEKLVKISGLPVRETQILDPGVVLRHIEARYVPEWFCKATGLVIFGLVYLVLLLADFNRGYIHIPRPKAHYGVVGGTAVYDMQ